MVHRREVAGQELVFGNHGALWGNAMTWWDHETGSVWSQPIGEAIVGPLKGERLELLPSSLVSWGDWKQQHPGTVALDAPNFGDGYDLDQMAIVVELGAESVAFPVTEVRRVHVVNDWVNDAPVAVVVDPESDQWVVFSRQLDDRVVELEAMDGLLAEVGGIARWDPVRGLAQEGDQNLNILPGFTSFPRDYVTFFPDGAFWTNEGPVPASQ
jgi:hypothetical protein